LIASLVNRRLGRRRADRWKVHALCQEGRRDAGVGHPVLSGAWRPSASLTRGRATKLMAEPLAIAVRLGDGPVRAYARYGLMLICSMLGMDTLEAIDQRKSEMIEDILHFGDNCAGNWSHWIIAMDYMFRLKGARGGGAAHRVGRRALP
jgi:hypothetical protein